MTPEERKKAIALLNAKKDAARKSTASISDSTRKTAIDLIEQKRAQRARNNMMSEVLSRARSYESEIPDAYKEILERDDFTETAKKGSEIKGHKTYTLNNGKVYTPAWYDPLYTADLGTSVFGSMGMNTADNIAVYDNLYVENMTTQEKAIYDYLRATDDPRAGEYLYAMRGAMNKRVGQKIADQANGNWFANAGLIALGGLERAYTDIDNVLALLSGKTPKDNKAITYASEAIKSKTNNGFERFTYDLIDTGSYMLPSILVGSLTGGTGGAIMMGAQAASGGYAEMRRLGYSAEQSALYGTIIGVLEGSLGSILGGIKQLGGGVLNKVFAKALSKLDNSVAKLAIKVGDNAVGRLIIDMGKEGLEEGLQEVLEPIVRHYATGEDYDPAELGDVLYAALLGAVNSGIINGSQTVTRAVAKNRAYTELGDRIINLEANEKNYYAAAKATGDTRLSKLADKAMNTEKEHRRANKLGKLAEAVDTEFENRHSADLTWEEASRLGASPEEYFATDEFDAAMERINDKKIIADLHVNNLSRAVSDIENAGEISDSDYENRYGGALGTAYKNGYGEYSESTKKSRMEYALYTEMARNLGMNSDGKTFGEMIKTLPVEEQQSVLELPQKVIEEAFADGVTVSERESKIAKMREEARKIKTKKARELEKKQNNPENESEEIEEEDDSSLNTSNVIESKKLADRKLTDKQKKSVARIKALAKLVPGYTFFIGTGADIASDVASHNNIGDSLKRELEQSNGYYNEKTKTVFINVEAGRVDGVFDFAIDSTLTHEIVHSIRDNAPLMYEELKAFVESELYTPESWNAAVKKRQAQYAGIFGGFSYAKAEEEVVCNSLGDLITKESVMDKLANEKPKLYIRIWRLIRDFFAKITGKHERANYSYVNPEEFAVAEKLKKKSAQLEEIFAKALRTANLNVEAANVLRAAETSKTATEAKKQPTTSVEGGNVSNGVTETEKAVSGTGGENMQVSNVKGSFSLNEFEDGQRFVELKTDQKLFDNLTIKEQTDLAAKILKERFRGKVIGIDNRAYVNRVTTNEYLHPAKHMDNELYQAKMRSSAELDNLMDAGYNFRTEADGNFGHKHENAVGGFNYFDVIFKIGEEYYKGVINVMVNQRGKLLKDVTKIENITQSMTAQYGKNRKYVSLRDASMNSIQQSDKKSNPFNESNQENKEKSAKQKINGSFSISLGGSNVPVDIEEHGDLMAIHNLTEQNLLETLKLGGFPMPSIAVIRKGQEHSKYGDISVVFGKNTIDPEGSIHNKIYGSDAWTPTYPKIEYKPDPAVASKISNKYYELANKYGYDEVRKLYPYAENLEERLNRANGERQLLEELYDDTDIMQIYLLDSGKNKIPTVKKETRTEFSKADIELNEYLIDKLGTDFVEHVRAPKGVSPFSYTKNYVSDNIEKIKSAYGDYLSEHLGFAMTKEEIQDVLDINKLADYVKMMRSAYDFAHGGSVKVKIEDDYAATEKAIREAVNESDYRAWVNGLFRGIESKSGIRNKKDYYDKNGNPRDWDALHLDNTIDNVIRVMREDIETGAASMFSGNTIWGVAAKQYKNLDEVRADKERLKVIPEEEYKAQAEKLGARLERIARSIKRDSESNILIAIDDAMGLIVEAVRTSKTKPAMLKYLTTYAPKATKQTVEDIVALVNDISNMPTGYFEAKPRRAVGFDEILMVELPDTASETLKERLAEKNIPFEIYGNSDSERAKAINNLEGVSFSLSDKLDREMLAGKFAELAETDEEKKLIREYLAETDSVSDRIDERRANIARLEELKGVNGMSGERARLRAEIETANKYITSHDERLLEIEAAAPFREVIDRYRKQRTARTASDPNTVTMSRGAYNQAVAKYTKDKMYTKREAQTALDNVYPIQKLTLKTRDDIYNSIWQGLNALDSTAEREKFAETQAQRILEAVVRESEVNNPDWISSRELLAYLHDYKGRLGFSESLKEEILHKFDKQGSQAFFGRWGNKSDKPAIPADEFITALAREYPGYEHLENAATIDALEIIDDAYVNARDTSPYIQEFEDTQGSELSEMKNEIKNKILDIFETGGTDTELKRNRDEIAAYLDEETKKFKAKLVLARISGTIREKRFGMYETTAQVRGDSLLGVLRDISKFEWRHSESLYKARDKVTALLTMYNKNHFALGYIDEQTPGLYSESIREKMEKIASGKGNLTSTDLDNLAEILSHLVHVFENFNKVWIKGKWVDAADESTKYISKLAMSHRLRSEKGKLSGLVDLIRTYSDTFLDTHAVAFMHDRGVENGYYSSMINLLEEASVENEILFERAIQPLSEFIKNNSDYLNNLQTERVEVFNKYVPKNVAIMLYMTLKQPDSRAGFIKNGFVYYNEATGERIEIVNPMVLEYNGNVHRYIREEGRKRGLTEEEIDAIISAGKEPHWLHPYGRELVNEYTEREIAKISKKLNSTDTKFISILEHGFNNTFRDLKSKTDVQRLGFASVKEGYYVPVIRADVAKGVQQITYLDEMQAVSNIAANKHRTGSSQMLLIIDPVQSFLRHGRAITSYATLQPVVDYVEKVYYADKNAASFYRNDTKPENVKRYSDLVWGKQIIKGQQSGTDFLTYFKNLVADVSGHKNQRRTWVNDVIRTVRAGVVRSALAVNPKVWLTQASSYTAALNVITASSLAKGMKAIAGGSRLGTAILTEDGRKKLEKIGAEVDKYCPFAWLRNHENPIFEAQAVVESGGKYKAKNSVTQALTKFSDKTMEPIARMDRAIVCALFEACKYETAKGNVQYGSERNLEAAGELLKKVILQTQQTNIATTKSAAMNSGGEITRTLTMFTADTVRSLSRLTENALSVYYAFHKVTRAKSETEKAKYKAEIMQSAKKLGKSVGVITINAAYMAAIGVMFKALYGKLDDDDNVIEILAGDFASGIFAGLPLISDAIDLATNGYGLDHYALGAFNDLVQGVIRVYKNTGKLLSGEGDVGTVIGSFKTLLFTVSQIIGVPARNIWNILYGIIDKISGDAAKAIDKFLR